MNNNNNFIPDGWMVKKLGDCFDFSAGGDVDKSCFSKTNNESHPYPIFANALTNAGLYGYSSKYKTKEKSITITGRGDIGKIVYRDTPYTAIVRLIIGIPKDGISAKFMSYSCSAIHFFNETTGVPQLTVPQVRWYKTKVPPLVEQERIAAVLGLWDGAIENMESKIHTKRTQKRGLMQRLLTGDTRIPGFAKPWKTVKLGDICDITSASSKSAYKTISGLNFIVDMGAISADGKLVATKKTDCCDDFLSIDDLVMPKDDIGGGNIIGKTARIPEDNKYILGDHVFKIKIRSGSAEFFTNCINSFPVNKGLRRMTTGSAQLGLAKKDVLKTKITIPTDIDEQRAIADVLVAADTEIDLLNQKLDALKQEKRGLMQQLLTGRIRTHNIKQISQEVE